MLKIIPPSEVIPVENIILTPYGAPSSGKTSLAFTAENPLLLDADKGSHRASNIKHRVIVDTWADVVALRPEDIAPYATIILDTAGTFIQKLMAHLISLDPKNAGPYGGMSGKGWGNLNSAFDVLVQSILGAKKDLVIVCHMDEQEKNGEITERIDAQGKPRNLIYRLSDAMCRIQINPDGSRFLNFDPREGGYGKNPAQLPKVPFPHPSVKPDTLACVIADIKAALNRQTEAQAEAVKEEQSWDVTIAGCESLDDFNLLLKLAQERKYRAPMKKSLLAGAEAKGFVFAKELKQFVAHAVPEGVA